MKEFCVHCNRRPRFERHGKTYNLCAVCGWTMLCKLLKLSDDTQKTHEQKVIETIDYIPYSEWQND